MKEMEEALLRNLAQGSKEFCGKKMEQRQDDCVSSCLKGVERDYYPFFDTFLFGALNPLNMEMKHSVVRLVFVLVVVSVGYMVTFFYSFMEDANLKLLLGGLSSFLFLQFCIYVSSRFIWNRDYLNEKNGFPNMVNWMGFWMFLDCAHHFVHPVKEYDARSSEKVRADAEVIDERSNATLEADGRFYFDFVADVGDGFSSCYSVAALMAQDRLVVQEHRASGTHSVELPRASVVLVGGDIVYPFPSEERFLKRFIQPYSWAFPAEETRGERMYYTLGNHEYLDGCYSFRNYLLPMENVGGWKTPQKGLYFAMTLPNDWWLFNIDLGPEPEDIDPFQMDFFLNVAKENIVGKDDRIIMVYHVPDWIKRGKMDSRHYVRLGKLRQSLGEKVRLVLAGDLHYYRRMEVIGKDEPSPVETSETNCYETDRQTFIVAGHGGAFSHATHFPLVERISNVAAQNANDMVTRTCYPTVEESTKACWSDKRFTWFFTTTNSYYMRVLGSVYALMFFCVVPSYHAETLVENASIFSLIAMGWLFVTHHIFTTASHSINTHYTYMKVLMLVTGHSMGHILLALVLKMFCEFALFTYWPGFGIIQHVFISTTAMYAFGSILGPLLSTLYFEICMRFFDWHWNESIALVQNQDHKGFLRLAFNENGDIDVYALGIEKTPQQWQHVPAQENDNPNRVLPTDIPLKYHLIERTTVKK